MYMIELCDEEPMMEEYIAKYGWHFSNKSLDYAVSLMEKRDGTKVKSLAETEFRNKLKTYGVDINGSIYDAMFVYHMGLADYFGSSITDEKHLFLYVKDTIEDIDASPGTTFKRWIATMEANDVEIPWCELI